MSFTGFQAPALDIDPSIIKQRIVAYLQAYMPPGWRLQIGELADLIIEAVSEEAAIQNAVVMQNLVSDLRYIGLLANCPPIDAIPASATITIEAVPPIGVTRTADITIPAGSVFGLYDATGVLQGFDLTDDVVLAPGATTGTGTVVCETPGVAGNGLSGTAQLVQAPGFVTGAAIGFAGGGKDAELDAVYLQRLAETLTTLAQHAILAPDFAIQARSVAGVYRATAVNLLKPGPPYDGAAEATGQEKNVTVAVTDLAGISVGSTIRGNVQTFLESIREDNFVVWVVDAQYNEIDVTVTVGVWPGWDLTDVEARVTAQLTDVSLSPALFGTDPSGSAARWANDPVLRASYLTAGIFSVPGVRYVGSLTFGVHGGGLGTGNVTLGSGSLIPALPTPGTITLTMVATT